MKICLCGSIAFFDEMLNVKKELESLGHEVKLPPNEVENKHGEMVDVREYYRLRQDTSDEMSWVWTAKEKAIRCHFNKIEWSEVILVLNYDKRGVEGYVGGNTLMEMGLALHLNKKIFLWKNIPELSYKEEILGMKPVVVNEDISRI
jgi:hypothetical protein